MSDVFISYARSTASQARQVAEVLRALGYGEAENALALCRQWTSARIKTLATGRPEPVKLFVDGIPLAEGKAGQDGRRPDAAGSPP